MVEKQLKEVEVTKEAAELANALAGLVVAIKAKAKDGLKIEEVFQAVAEKFESVVVGVQGADKLGDEVKLEPGAFMRAWALAGSEVLDAFSKEPA